MNIVHALPPIAIGGDDFHRLALMVEVARARSPAIADFLHRELSRAELVEPWFGLVSMGSIVRFMEKGVEGEQVGRLSYPVDMARFDNPISILSETGAALIGLCEGQSIYWRSAEGRLRSITVLRSD